MINHVKVYIVQMECIAPAISYIIMIATRERLKPWRSQVKKISGVDNWLKLFELYYYLPFIPAALKVLNIHGYSCSV